MHIGLNLVFLVPGETGGMEVAARALIPELRKAAPGVRFTAFVCREAAGEDFGIDTVPLAVNARSRPQWVMAEQALLPRMAKRLKCDIVHSLASTACAYGQFKRVVTIHDLNYRAVPDAHFGLRALGMRALVPLAARSSHRVIVDSESTRTDVMKHLGVSSKKIDVVPLGVAKSSGTLRTSENELRARFGLGQRPVLLSLSAKRPHKNLTGLLDALAHIPSERRPIAVLPGYPTPHEEELRVRATKLGIEEDVRFVGWVSKADTEGLFALSSCFVFPSFYEGFGLPVLEAMARGVPVACSNRASLPEVAGDAALLFDPEDPAGIARAIETLLTDPILARDLAVRGREQAAGFSWKRTAELTFGSYERVLTSFQ